MKNVASNNHLLKITIFYRANFICNLSFISHRVPLWIPLIETAVPPCSEQQRKEASRPFNCYSSEVLTSR